MALVRTHTVFLSHNSADKPLVEEIKRKLESFQRPLRCWLDTDDLRSLGTWMTQIEEILSDCDSAALFFSSHGRGPIHDLERQKLIDRAARERDSFWLVPVLLPGAKKSDVDDFTSLFNWVDLSAGLDSPAALESLARLLRGEAPAAVPPDDHIATEPYRGLERFETKEHARFFFGRDREIRELCEHLTHWPLVAVIGGSGCGKSSLVRAGLQTDLALTELPQLRSAIRITFITGANPLRAMAEQIGAAVKEKRESPEALADRFEERFHEREDGLLTLLTSRFQKDHQLVLLIVDQFEELFTHQSGGPEKNDRFVALLHHVACSGPDRLRIVITLRSDFYPACLDVPRLRALIPNHELPMGELSPVEIRDVIVRSAQKAGAYFEKGLVARVLADVEGQSGFLPLLEFALKELWAQRRGRWLTNEGYDATGGVAGALRGRADAVLSSLSPSQLEMAKAIFLRLTTLGEGVGDTRRRIRLDQLYPADPKLRESVQAVIDRLRGKDARLIVTNDDGTVEVTHEALMQRWDQFRHWLAESRDQKRLQDRLRDAAEEWLETCVGDATRRDTSLLWRGSRLVDGEELAHRDPEMLNEIESAFVGASVAKREAERAEEEHRRQRELRLAQEREKEAKARAEDNFHAEQRLKNSFARSYWQDARRSKATDPLLSLHLMTEAAAMAADPSLRRRIYLDHRQALSMTRLVWSADVEKFERAAGLDVFNIALTDSEAAIVSWSVTGVKRWRLGQGNSPEVLVAQDRFVGGEFNDAKTLLLLWTADGQVDIFDVATRRLVGLEVHHDGAIRHARFAPGDLAFVAVDELGLVHAWDVNTGACIGHTEAEEGSLEVLTVSPSGSHALVVLRCKEQLYETHYYVRTLWDLRAQKVLARNDEMRVDQGPDPGVGGIFSRDGESFLTWDGELAWVLHIGDGQDARVSLRHPKNESVKQAFFDDTERQVVTWTTSGVIRVWDRSGGGEAAVTLPFGEEVERVAILEPATDRIFAWSSTGAIRIWDMGDGSPIGDPLRHGAAVKGIRLSPDGRLLLSWGADGAARVWDLSKGCQATPAMTHRFPVSGAQFIESGSRILTWGGEGTIRCWEITPQGAAPTAQILTWCFGPGSRPRGANYGFNEDRQRVLTWADDGTLTVWDLADEATVIRRQTLPEATSVVFEGRRDRKGSDEVRAQARSAFDRQGTRLVTYGGKKRPLPPTLWDLETGRALCTLEKLKRVRFNREGTRFVTLSKKGVATVRDSRTGKPLATDMPLLEALKKKEKEEAPRRITDLVVNSSGDRIAVIYPDDEESEPLLRLWDTKRRRFIGSRIDLVSGAQFNRAGDRLLCWLEMLHGEGHRIQPKAVLVDAASGTIIKNDIALAKWNPNQLFDHTGSCFLADRAIIDSATGKTVRKVWKGAFDPSRTILLVDHSPGVQLLEAGTGKPTGPELSHDEDERQVFCHGQHVVIVGSKTIRVWSLENGEPFGVPMPLDDNESVRAVVLSPQGGRLVTIGSYKGDARLRDPISGLRIGGIMRHYHIDGAAVSEEYGLIMTWSMEDVRIWDYETAEPLGTELRPHDWIAGAFLVPGQLRVVAWGEDVGSEWDLSADCPMPDRLRHQLMLTTGSEYDVNTRDIRMVPTDAWETMRDEDQGNAARY